MKRRIPFAHSRTTLARSIIGAYDKLLGPLLIAIGIFYLAFHSLNGDRGVYALLKEQRKLEVMQKELSELVEKRKDMEHHTRLMNSGSLDVDLLDEQSRRLLGIADDNEVMIPLEPIKK